MGNHKEGASENFQELSWNFPGAEKKAAVNLSKDIWSPSLNLNPKKSPGRSTSLPSLS
jgi:hypothetical protein